MKQKSPYDVLGVEKDATPDEIKKAFRRKAKKVHPDKGGKTEEFHEAENAYAVLANPSRRKRFDETGETESAETFEKQVQKELQGLVVATIQLSDWQHDDIFECMRTALRVKIGEFRKEKAGHKKEAAKFKDAAGRVKRKDKGENVVQIVIEAQKRHCDEMAGAIDKIILLLEAVVVQLDLYEWRVDEKKPEFKSPLAAIFKGSMVESRFKTA